jgi:hypothetical protein
MKFVSEDPRTSLGERVLTAWLDIQISRSRGKIP